MDKEKRIVVQYGDGTKFVTTRSRLPKAQEMAEFLRQGAHKPGSGFTPEEADRIFTLTIIEEEE